MSTLPRAGRRANQAPTPTTRSILWHSLLKVAEKEATATRDDLAQGSIVTVRLIVSGLIDGQPIADQPINGTLTVGHDSTRATSSTPALPLIVGHILAKLNERTREAVLRDLPELFAANGCSLPDVPEAIAEKCAAMLVRLRAKKAVDVRGSVTCPYSLSEDGSEDDGDQADRFELAEREFAVVG